MLFVLVANAGGTTTTFHAGDTSGNETIDMGNVDVSLTAGPSTGPSGGTTPEPSATTRTQGTAADLITGYLTISGVAYDALNDNTQLKTRFANECADTLASAAGTAVANVRVELFRGDTSQQVSVEYEFTLPADESQAAFYSLSAARLTTLGSDLTGALQTIPGIDSVLVQSLFEVSYIALPTHARADDPAPEDALAGGALRLARPVLQLTIASIVAMAPALAQPLAQRPN